jgi:endonuclease/exonuclease/phosphatase (EEP) superfamily protein YafD
MTGEAVIKKIVDAFENKLADLAIADHMDVLNALTELMIATLKTAEYLAPAQAYRRASEVFIDAAIAEEAEEAEAKAKAKAAARAQRPVRVISTQKKFERFQRRQQLVAARAARQARKGSET